MTPHQAQACYAQAIEEGRHTAPRHRKQMHRTMAAMARRIDAAVLDAPDEDVLAWSDLHLGHANVIEYSTRPFADVNAMNEHLWSVWEREAKPERTLVVVGDLAMREALAPQTWERLKALPGASRQLVIGNHDLTGAGTLRVQGFDRVWSTLLSGGSPPLIWTHLPLAQVPEGWVNVHGHLHATPPGRTRHINVSVEQLRYAPVTLDRLRTLARALAAGAIPDGQSTIERIETLERKAS